MSRDKEYSELTTLMNGIGDTLNPYAEGRAARLYLESIGQANYSEWQAVYFEHMFLKIFESCYEPQRPKRYVNTAFDYRHLMNWDIKTKVTNSKSSSWVILNDLEATYAALADGPLYYVVISGEATFDEDGSFHDWWRETHPSTMKRTPKYSRKLKTSFLAKNIEVFGIPSQTKLHEYVEAGIIKQYNQGKNSSGDIERNPKLQMHLGAARSEPDLIMFNKEWKAKNV